MSKETAKRFTIVRLPPQEKDVYFVVPADYDEYAVNEGTCPTNLFVGGCEQIMANGDSDPHGLFEFVRIIDRPEFLDRSHRPNEEWPKIIPEAYPKDLK